MKTRKESKSEGYSSPREVDVVPTGIGLLPDEVYDRAMSWWRSGIRKALMRSLAWESRTIAAMQVSVQNLHRAALC